VSRGRRANKVTLGETGWIVKPCQDKRLRRGARKEGCKEWEKYERKRRRKGGGRNEGIEG